MTRKKGMPDMVARWLTAAGRGFLLSGAIATAVACASEGVPKRVPGGVSSRRKANNPATAETLTIKDARRLIESAGEVLSLPRLSDLSREAARELATYRDHSGTCTYKVCVPVAEEKTITYSVMVPYSEETVREDGTKVAVTKCRPETRTKTVTVTICLPEERSHACPLTLILDSIVSPKPEVLAELAKHDGNLHLNGFKALSRAEAQQLVAHKGGSLVLDGLGSLDADVAEVLVAHEGDISLNGLHTVSTNTAKALSQSKHRVSLDGLTVLSDEVAAELAMHGGSVSLKGVKQISDQAIELLRSKPVSLPQEFLSGRNQKP